MTGRSVAAPRPRGTVSLPSAGPAVRTGSGPAPDSATGAAPAGDNARRDATTHGRNRVSTRALTRVVAAITAEAMGVSSRQVSVHLADAGGQLQVTAIAPISVPALTARRRAGAEGDSLLARAATAQAAIRDRVQQLTGSAVGPVTLRLSDAQIAETERVT